jgi:hypothetical protein
MFPSVATEKIPSDTTDGSIPRPSDKQRSTLTTTLPQAPTPTTAEVKERVNDTSIPPLGLHGLL